MGHDLYLDRTSLDLHKDTEMKINIPEIGTKLKLAAPWEFAVFYERRNAGLIEYAGWADRITLGAHPTNGMPKEEAIESAKQGYRSFHYPLVFDGKVMGEQQGHYWHSGVVELDRLTLPIGAVLTVDRIYIRKGKDMSQFSSVSFILAGEKTKKKTMERTAITFSDRTKAEYKYTQTIPSRAVRFWAKLADVNTMEVEA
jgi:hypothetical protein